MLPYHHIIIVIPMDSQPQPQNSPHTGSSSPHDNLVFMFMQSDK